MVGLKYFVLVLGVFVVKACAAPINPSVEKTDVEPINPSVEKTDVEQILDGVSDEDLKPFLRLNLNKGYVYHKKPLKEVTIEEAEKLYLYYDANFSTDSVESVDPHDLVCFDENTCIYLDDSGIHP